MKKTTFNPNSYMSLAIWKFFFKIFDNLFPSYRIAKTLKNSYSVMAMITLAIISNFGVAHAQIGTGTASVDPPTGGFKIDGTLLTNSNIGDWLYGSGTGGFVLNNNGTPVNPGTTFWMQDNYDDGTNQDNVFTGTYKINENPTNWLWKLGAISPGKNDMNNAFVHFTTAENGNVWVIFAADRLTGGTNNSYMDFEFLQNSLIKNDNGTFTTEGTSNGRTYGDFILSVAFSANPSFYLLSWDGSSFVDKIVDPGNVYAAANTGATPIPVPYGAFGSYTYTTNQFIEVAVNLTELLAVVDPCNDMKIKTIFVKTKASTGNSNINDFISPLQVPNISIGNANAGPDDSVCFGQSYQLDGSATASSGYSVSHYWTLKSGDASISDPNALDTNVTINSGSSATFLLTVTATKGASTCFATDEVTITVNPLPEAPTTNPVTYCEGDIADPLTATGTNLKWYTTPTDGIGSSTAPTPSTVSVGTTTYYVSQTNAYNCEGPRASIVVTVNPLPTAPTTSPVTYCAGDIAIPLTATGTNLNWYTTPTGGTGSSTAPTPSTVSAGTTTYYVSQTNTYNCEGPRASIVVTVNELPIINQVTALNPTIATCPLLNNGSITINATGTNLQYSINNGVTYQSSNIFNGLTSGTYQIVVKNSITNCLVHHTENVVLTNPICVSEVGIVATTNAAEPNTNGLFTLTLTNPLVIDTEITYTVTGTATNGTDYATIGTKVTILANQTSATIPVNVIDDNIIEATETVIITLISTNTLVTVDPTKNIATVLITDNDGGPQNGLVINDVTVNEGAGNAIFTVTLTGNVQGGFTVNYATANGSAIAPGDYTSTNGTLTFTGNNNEVKTITVPIIDDNLIEPTENFFVNLNSLSTTLIGINDDQGMGTILDNDGGGQNGLVINDVTVNESAGNAIFTVTLTGNVQGGFTVNYATANGSAIAPGDYTSTNGTLTFTGNNNEVKTITVPIIDDNLIEPTENFFVNLSSLSTTLIGINDDQGMGTILDNDGGGQNGLVINDVTVNENAGNAIFTITLTGNVQGGFTVNYATANGSAIAPGDYTSTNGTLTFTGNNNEVKTITVPIIDDNLIEPTENFFVNLSSLSTTLIGINDGQGMGTILDNDGGGQNGLVINDVTVNENAGNAIFTVTLTGNVQGGFTVNYATANGSAIAPGDYTSTNGTLTFTGNNNEVKTITVPIIDDNLIEPTENFFVNLSNLSTTLIGINDGQGMGTILDNDGGGQNGLVINDVTVNENAGNAIFTVTLTGNVQGGFTVNYATANGSAIAPGDYTSTNGTLTFTGNNNEAKTITVPIIDDNLIEPTENFFVNLSSLSTTLIGINDGQGMGTILDNDGGGNNGLSIGDVTVNEGAGTASFPVTLTGNVQGGFTVNYATANGSAIAPGDYTSINGTLTFTGTTGETHNVVVPIIDDNLIEPTENFFVNLSELTTVLIGINDGQGMGTILDNDGGGQNGLVINDVTVNEDDGNAAFTVTLTGNVQGGFTVDYATANGSAIAPGDYTSTSGTLTFAGNNNESKTITVPIIDDSWIEPTENFFVNLSELSTDLIAINDAQGLGTIIDNDGSPLNGLVINDVTVNEGAGNAVFNVTLTGNVQGGFTVDYATANGSAIAPGDYTSTSGTLTFIGTTGETKTITVPIINDNLIEPTENFFVNLSSLSTTLIGINDGQGIGTIIDNDGGPQNGLVINNVTVNEGAGNAIFIVTLTGNVQGAFTVNYATANGSAIAPGDYTLTSGLLTFTGTTGETKTIAVPIINDNLIEPTENFFVNLSNLSTTLISINDGQGIGTIIDNDGGPQNGLVISDVTVNEDDGNAIFTVTLTGNVQGSFTVNYATENGSAIAPGDYTSTAGTLTFTGTTGETKTITVPIIDDSWIEPTEIFFVNLSNLSTTLISINDGQGTGTITDNDGGPENGLVINNVTVNEDAGNATFTVTLTGNIQGGFTVGYATANGSAIAPGDYTSTAGTLTFIGTTGETKTITVPIIDDSWIEPTENFFVNLSNLSTVLIGINDGQGLGTITDNDGSPQNGLVINNVTVNEDAGNATFTVTLTGNIQGGFTVGYATANGSAIAPGDYTSTAGILTFTGTTGETKTITVPIIDDSWIEPTENFFVNLSELSTNLIGINDAQGEGTITDNDGGPENGLVINNVTVNEDDGNATFTVTLTGNVQGGFTVGYATANGSASAPGDYTTASGTLNFVGTTGEIHSIVVPIIDDNLIEPTENFFVNLSELSTNLIGINDAQGEGIITDNDGGPQNGLAINNVTVSEGDGNATFMVTLTGNVQGGFTVAYATANGTALAPGDYTITTGILNFTGTTGETHNIVVPIINDNLIEPTENFFVNLSALSTNLIGINDAQGEGTITDNDGGSQNGLAINDVKVNEDGGNATFIVTLTGNVQGGFTVNYATANGSAIALSDYTATSGTLNFVGTSGETHTIVVPIINDNVIESTENFFVNLSDLSTNLISINDSQGEGTIIDNDLIVTNDTAIAIDRNPITINILANDSYGPDDTIVSVVVTTNPQHGTVTINSNNNVIYTANNGYFGLDTFNYTLTVANTDGSLNSGVATVTVTVRTSPNAVNDSAETESNIFIVIDILANDTDADGTIVPTSVTIIEEPENGTVVINSDGSVTYTPDLDFISDDTFTYQVCDNDGLCDTATVSIVVAGVLAAELIIPQGFSPNDDGIHDEFDVEGLSNLYPNFNMVIYNRWGIVVYDYTHNGNPLSEPIWWDGYSRGRMTLGNGPAPVGTYFYTLYFNKDGAKPRSGYLYLNR